MIIANHIIGKVSFKIALNCLKNSISLLSKFWFWYIFLSSQLPKQETKVKG